MANTTLIEDRVKKLDEITLLVGGHEPPNGGFEACAMEAVSWIAGERWSDRPECVSPVIAAFMRQWNDDLDDDERQMLKPYLPRVVGTADEHDEERAWMVTDWLVRVFAPAWLELAGVGESPAALRSLPPVTEETMAAAQPTIDEAEKKGSAACSAAGSAVCSAAWSAACSAAWSAAWSAAESAACSAAESAACSAAGSAAGSVAWSVAESAAWSAAGSAVCSAAESAACSAAGSAAGSAAWSVAGSAARSAAEKALEPTKVSLQQSALELLDNLIEVGKEAS